MKKFKIADKIDECFDDYGLENVDVMINFIKMLQDGSLALTKLILENCKNDNFKKEDILAIFEEATATVANSIKNSSKNIVKCVEINFWFHRTIHTVRLSLMNNL